MIAAEPERLSWRDHLWNFDIAVHDIWRGWDMGRFLWRINAHRGAHVRRGFRWPRTIRVDVFVGENCPGGVLTHWEQFGIPAVLLPGSFVSVSSGRRERVCSFWVSPDAHWMADRVARPVSFVVSPAVICRRRGSSGVDAERGAWKASGREPRARSLTTSLIRLGGNLLGVRQAYVNIARNAPGLRAGNGKKKGKGK